MPLRCARRAVRTSAALAFLLGVSVGEEGDSDFGLGGGARDPKSDRTGEGMDRAPLLQRAVASGRPNPRRETLETPETAQPVLEWLYRFSTDDSETKPSNTQFSSA
jgi:hypothetical protein